MKLGDGARDWTVNQKVFNGWLQPVLHVLLEERHGILQGPRYLTKFEASSLTTFHTFCSSESLIIISSLNRTVAQRRFLESAGSLHDLHI